MSEPQRSTYSAYAAIIGAFTGVLVATASLEKRPRRMSALDLALLSAATFKASRALSRERVGSVMREPFVEGEGPVERPAGQGMRRAIGELVTCTRCTGTWAAAGLVAAETVAPRFGRVLTVTLAAGAANDFLQAAFAALCGRADSDGVASDSSSV